MTIAAIVLIPVASIKSMKGLNRLTRHDLLLILVSSVFIALHFGLWITSLNYTSIASSVVLVTSHPAFVAVMSYFLWSERLNKLAIGGIIVVLTGIISINYGGLTISSQALLGDLLALIAGFSMGAYLIIGGQLRKRIDVLTYLTIIYSCSAVILIIATVSFGYSLFGYSPMTYLMLILLAIVPQLIGHSCLNIALRLIPVTFVSVAILGEPVGATLLGCLILSEIPTANEVVGGVLIIGGILMVLRQKPKDSMMK